MLPSLLSAGVGAALVALTMPRVGHWRLEALYTGRDRWAGQAIEMGTTGVNYAGLMRGGSSREGFEGLVSQGDTALQGQRWRDDLTPFLSAKRSHRLTEGRGACDLKGYLHFPGLDVRGSRWCMEWRVMVRSGPPDLENRPSGVRSKVVGDSQWCTEWRVMVRSGPPDLENRPSGVRSKVVGDWRGLCERK
ncbi:hypothetical protein C8F04DRAFT_1302157 [Mycena alexandri]|uniref:Uncharacterized protein n=1 Tax=Mycena alexandri TaxID=1745969 RepID=A0AAD6X982_9AGAR|nr:hypothetical protein C8F04DRAFT_1302157 [Mycena alexandri]